MVVLSAWPIFFLFLYVQTAMVWDAHTGAIKQQFAFHTGMSHAGTGTGCVSTAGLVSGCSCHAEFTWRREVPLQLVAVVVFLIVC